jgi:protein-tyrosine phosphatase
MNFIDIHSHLLPGFDDGAENWDISLAMLRQGAEDGIQEVVCTPHILSKNDLQKQDQAFALHQELKDRAKQQGLDLKIHLGSELYIQPDLELDQPISTLGQNGRYFLVEFPMNGIPDFAAQRFFDILMDNKIPIIAHPERNVGVIKNPESAAELVRRGALLQLNSGSLLGVFGQTVKAVALQLIEADMIHIVSSDAHDLKSRPLKLKDAYDLVLEKWGKKKADSLFYENSRKVLNALDVEISEPKPINSAERLSLPQRFNLFIKNLKTG